MTFTRQEYWSGLLFPSIGDLSDPGIEPRFLALQADYILSELESEICSVVSDSLQPHGQNIGVRTFSLLQGIFPTQGLNPGLPYWRRILYQLSHRESPRILERVAYPFSRGSSQPRNWTGVSCIAYRFFNNWVIREAWVTREIQGKWSG